MPQQVLWRNRNTGEELMLISELEKILAAIRQREGDIQTVVDPISPSSKFVQLVEGAEAIYVTPTDNSMLFDVNADARDDTTKKVVYIW